MIRDIKAITAFSFLSMLFLGVGTSLIGATARNIGLTPYEIGVIIAVQNVGFGLAVFLSGALADTRDKARLLVIGCLVLGLAFLAFYQSPLFWINLVIMLFIGMGMGTCEGVTDAMLLDIHHERESRYITINHLFVTLGSGAITVYLIFLQMNWRTSVIQAGIGVLLLAGFFALVRLPRRNRPHVSYRERVRHLNGKAPLALLFLASSLAVGAETGVLGILTTFLTDMRGFDLITSKIGLVVLLVGIAAGRLLIGLLSQEHRIPYYVVGLLGLSVFLFGAIFFINAGPFTYILIFLAGMAMSAQVPLILSLAGLAYKENAGTVMGIIKTAFPMGGILVPFLMSMVTRSVNFQASLLVFPLVYIVSLLLFVATGYVRPTQAWLGAREGLDTEA